MTHPPTAPAASPFEHVLQHPLVTRPAHLGFLTPQGVITLLSDHIVMLITAGVLLMLVVPLLVTRRKGADEVGRLVPAGPANFLEAICEFLRKNVAQPTLERHTDRFVKYIWTVFFFILMNNLLGILPLGAVTPLFGTHIGGTPTGNIWVTGTLALLTLGMMLVNGLRFGGWHFFAHFCPGPLWLAPLLVPIEILGFFAKAFALAIRLFANMFAGHVVLAVLLSFILKAGSAMGAAVGLGIAVPVVLGSIGVSLLEIFVAFLQAFIFAFLTSLFIGQMILYHDVEQAPGHHAASHAGHHAGNAGGSGAREVAQAH
ncbi:MAG TPA: F0F1 ATP synthase subunit A [Thermoanaerobaculia bacterium]|nr:F0F1 ATP synthase subunit A [Thermoanaerobaculia bacterium]